MRPEKARHAFAFQLCVAEADHCIRTALPMPASGICICEDNDQPNFLRWVTGNLSRNPLKLPENDEYRIERMIDTVHFVRKGEAPIIALADVCAWVLKRYMNARPDADAFMRSLCSKRPIAELLPSPDTPRFVDSGWLTPADPFPPGDKTSVRPEALGWPSQRKPA